MQLNECWFGKSASCIAFVKRCFDAIPESSWISLVSSTCWLVWDWIVHQTLYHGLHHLLYAPYWTFSQRSRNAFVLSEHSLQNLSFYMVHSRSSTNRMFCLSPNCTSRNIMLPHTALLAHHYVSRICLLAYFLAATALTAKTSSDLTDPSCTAK